MENIEIKPATESDLSLLDHYLPSEIPDFHKSKITEQKEGKGLWLIAWNNRKPVARGQLQWEGSKRESVRQYVKDTPQIDSLEVVEEFRGKGIGTEVIKVMEEKTREKGFKQIGMAVEIENEGAIRLYEKLGYKNWGHGNFDGTWKYTDSKGEEHTVPESYTYLLKDLTH